MIKIKLRVDHNKHPDWWVKFTDNLGVKNTLRLPAESALFREPVNPARQHAIDCVNGALSPFDGEYVNNNVKVVNYGHARNLRQHYLQFKTEEDWCAFRLRIG